MFRLSRTFEGVRLTALHFRLERRPSFHYTEFMNKRPPAKKPQAKIQTVKKQIPVKKVAPDRIEELVKKHLGNIGEAENAFKSASALLEKHKTKYPELEQYIEHVSASDRSIQILEDNKYPRQAHYIFKILLTGVEPAYQVAHPGEKDHTNVDRSECVTLCIGELARVCAYPPQIVLKSQDPLFHGDIESEMGYHKPRTYSGVAPERCLKISTANLSACRCLSNDDISNSIRAIAAINPPSTTGGSLFGLVGNSSGAAAGTAGSPAAPAPAAVLLRYCLDHLRNDQMLTPSSLARSFANTPPACNRCTAATFKFSSTFFRALLLGIG